MVLSDTNLSRLPSPTLAEGSRLLAASRAGTLTRLLRLCLRDRCQFAKLQNLIRRRRGKQVHAPGYDSSPSGLVARAEPGPVIAVEVLVEQQQIAPVRGFLE